MIPHRPHNLARWQEYVAALPVDRWLTVAELARLWWPERYKGLNTTANRKRREAAEASATYRLRRMAEAGMVEVEARPHPTRAQTCLHVRRVE